MRLVIDTNVLLSSIGRKSTHHWIFRSLLEEKFELLVTTPILAEYHEKITEKTEAFVADNILKLLLSLPNVERIEVYYNWNFIEADPDDNAFADCAVAGSADFLVTEDRHFNVLSTVAFPRINVINTAGLKNVIGP